MAGPVLDFMYAISQKVQRILADFYRPQGDAIDSVVQPL